MSQSLELVGTDAAQRRLIATGERARKQQPTFEAEARRAGRLVTGIPVDTGRLAASAKGGSDQLIEAGPWGFAVLTKTPYARVVFRGTSTMDAKPPKVPTQTITRSTNQAVSRDLKRAR